MKVRCSAYEVSNISVSMGERGRCKGWRVKSATLDLSSLLLSPHLGPDAIATFNGLVFE
jgi:hypothetical protein